MKRGDCGCRNGKGTKKVKYASRNKAVEAIMKVYFRNAGGAYAYECPVMKGVWHVATDRKKKQK